MAHKFINQIEPGQTINDIYIAKDPILRSTSRGDLYIAMFLCDRTGQLNGRMWQATETVYRALPKPGFVHIQGRSELYQNNLQIIINFAELTQTVGQIKNAQLKALVEEFLADAALMDKFCNAPAAMKMHHDCIGGLLEHVHNMLRVAVAILPYYPDVQADLVLAGILLHDIGKTEELAYDMAFSYTDSGQLIGHIVKSVAMINEKVRALRAGITANTNSARPSCPRRLKPSWSVILTTWMPR
ncbi:MAG: hypothetical protein ACYTEK_25860 [Planctomycetota bacterium]|jgi:3'-5' exoribonuclease